MMRGNADSTIYIDSLMNTDDVVAGAARIQKAIKKCAEIVSKSGEYMKYSAKDAIMYVNNYAESLNETSTQNNKFLQELEQAKSVLEGLEKQGKWFGDEDYDEAVLKVERLEQAVKDYKRELLSPTEAANPFADGTYANKIREAEIALSRLAEAGKGLGDPAYDEAYRNLALIKDEARQYAAELAKTPAQIQREADALAAKEAKAEEARRRNEARVNAELQKIEELLAKEVQAAMESDRLKVLFVSLSEPKPPVFLQIK